MKSTFELVAAILTVIAAITGLVVAFKSDKKTDAHQILSAQPTGIVMPSNGQQSASSQEKSANQSTRDQSSGQQLVQGNVYGNQEIYFGGQDKQSLAKPSLSSSRKPVRKHITKPDDEEPISAQEMDAEEYSLDSVGRDNSIRLDTNGLGAAKFEVRMKSSYNN